VKRRQVLRIGKRRKKKKTSKESAGARIDKRQAQTRRVKILAGLEKVRTRAYSREKAQSSKRHKKDTYRYVKDGSSRQDSKKKLCWRINQQPGAPEGKKEKKKKKRKKKEF